VWLSNSWNNFAPYAGFMLKGYKKRGALERSGDEIDETGEDAPPRGETAAGDKSDNDGP
jgi:hypothetical protein